MGGDPDKPNLAMTMYRMVSDSDTEKYYYDNIWDLPYSGPISRVST